MCNFCLLCIFLKLIKKGTAVVMFRTLFTFFLDKKSNKKIKAANKKAEISHINLKSRNSPVLV